MKISCIEVRRELVNYMEDDVSAELRSRAACDIRCKSSKVRKSMVPNFRSSAGGPQIFPPIERYARSSFGG
jgi:hypothetical protein